MVDDGQGFLMLVVGFFMYKGLLKLIKPRKSLMGENNILTNLPVGVLELITKDLSINDYLALRAVCRSCRKTISNVIENKHCCHLPEMPQVFLPSKYSRSFFNLSKKSLNHHHHPQSKYPMYLTIPPLRYTNECIGSINGWLIMSDYSEIGFVECFFWNPVTDVRIMIPSKLSLHTYSSVQSVPRLRKMVASSKPKCDGSSDCHLVGLFNDFCHIAIYKRFEKSWTIVESDKDSESYFMDVEIIGTKLYVSESSSILVFCLKDSINGPPKAKVLAEHPTESFSARIGSNCISSFLGKDETLRELYFIYVFSIVQTNETRHVRTNETRHVNDFNFVPKYDEPPQVTNFEMFKLDTNKDSIEWQNVQLEDKVAFVSNLSNIVMSRDELNFNKDLNRGNIIYFAFNFPCPTNSWLGLQLGMFCLTDRSIKYFPVETLKYGDISSPVWFVPSLL